MFFFPHFPHCRQHLAEAEQQAKQDQQEAAGRFLDWASRKVPHAKYMNIYSGPQVRQLLFPDFVEGGVKMFKARNPEEWAELERQAGKKRPRLWTEIELHGVWGKGVPGKLQVEVKTAKDAPAVSGAVLK